MERHEILEMMGGLKLSGMRAAYDEIVTQGIKRSLGVERTIGALLKAEIAAKQARSINYQMGIAKLPLAKELAELSLAETPINSELIDCSPPVPSSTASATSSLSAALEPARPTSPSVSLAIASAPAGRHASSMPSTSSTSWKRRLSWAARAGPPTHSAASTC